MAEANKPNLIQRVAGETRSPDEIRDAVYLFTGDVPAKQSRFWLLLLLATGIATAGVISDSTATVIGAMIIAPLATPIQGVAVAIAFGESKALLKSSAILLGAIAATIAFGALLAWILPQLTPLSENSQVTGRVSPTLVDLVAAALTGLAGSFAISRRDVGDILPGVAIAISLVPPLAVVGVTAVAGDWQGAVGSMLLFLTNMLAIIVVGAILFSSLRIWEGHLSGQARFRVYVVVGLASLLVVAALAVVTYRTVQLSNWQQGADRVGRNWAEQRGLRMVRARFEGNRLVIVVAGDGQTSDVAALKSQLTEVVPDSTPVTLERVPGTVSDLGKVGN
ncbi:MAG: TIGR00341 family protein [Solirubrobacterales bacterium]|nr:TIGR00341 family protein [Solirubrobacterales bacterium]MCB8914597.1 TIGR00341 family protein [Thermoleophilales bacterium]